MDDSGNKDASGFYGDSLRQGGWASDDDCLNQAVSLEREGTHSAGTMEGKWGGLTGRLEGEGAKDFPGFWLGRVGV